jgi:hypothetical protein
VSVAGVAVVCVIVLGFGFRDLAHAARARGTGEAGSVALAAVEILLAGGLLAALLY